MLRSEFFSLLGVTPILLLACGEVEPVTTVPESKSLQEEDGADAQREVEPPPFAYSAVGKRNPFRSYFEEIKPPDPGRKRTPLERYEIDQLKLVAVMRGTAAPRAMVEDPAGRGHVVRVGSLVGRNGGQVKAIRGRGIVIHEELRTPGGRFVHPVLMQLPEEQIAFME